MTNLLVSGLGGLDALRLYVLVSWRERAECRGRGCRRPWREWFEFNVRPVVNGLVRPVVFWGKAVLEPNDTLTVWEILRGGRRRKVFSAKVPRGKGVGEFILEKLRNTAIRRYRRGEWKTAGLGGL